MSTEFMRRCNTFVQAMEEIGIYDSQAVEVHALKERMLKGWNCEEITFQLLGLIGSCT